MAGLTSSASSGAAVDLKTDGVPAGDWTARLSSALSVRYSRYSRGGVSMTADRVGVAVAVGVRAGVGEDVGVDVRVGVGAGAGDGTGDCGTGVAVPGTGVTVGVGGGVCVGVGVGVGVAVGVLVATLANVGVGEGATLGGLQPAASASATVQNQRSPLDSSIRVRS